LPNNRPKATVDSISVIFDADSLSLKNADVDGFSMSFVDNNTMMALIYDIPVGADAPQDPHGLDE